MLLAIAVGGVRFGLCDVDGVGISVDGIFEHAFDYNYRTISILK